MTLTDLRTRWHGLVRRIDAFSLRERVMLFCSLAAVLVAVADFFVLSPRLAEQKRLGQQLRTQTTQLDSLRQNLLALSGDGPAGPLQQALADTRRQLADTEHEIAQRQHAGQTGARLADLMDRVLRRHPRLTLQRLATGAALAVAPGLPPQQGVELAVAGSYPDLAQYVADLENELPGLRWVELAVVGGESGTQLQARVALPGEPR